MLVTQPMLVFLLSLTVICRICSTHPAVALCLLQRYILMLIPLPLPNITLTYCPFCVFEGGLQLICVLNIFFKAENAGHYPTEFEKLKGKRMLFKVEKCTGPSIFFDGSFRVKRICDDPAIIQSFDTLGGQYTPSKVLL